MFGKKKQQPQIDKEQLELIENAQGRIRQKKRLYIHFVVFLIGALFLILANTVLGIGKGVQFFGIDWFVFAVFGWLFIFIYHVFNVYVTHKFMGKEWEQQQLDRLVAKQKKRIVSLQERVEKNHPIQENTTPIAQKKKTLVKGLTLIVAVGENDAIGKDNRLIWHLSDDLKRFKYLTSGHHIIMGRKTFEGFPKPLPNRTHIVISRQANYEVPDGVILVNSLEDAVDAARNDSQPFVIGGGEIYRQAIAIADKIELTKVHQSFEADTFFPKIDTTVWKETHNKFHDKDQHHDYAFSFLTYERK
jgi:dihydrofolate reductase